MIRECNIGANPPYKCAGCHTGKSEYRYIDTGVFVEFYGNVILCEFCVNTTETLLDRGVLVEQRARIEELEVEVENGNRALVALDHLRTAFDSIPSIPPVASKVAAKGTARTKEPSTV